MATINGTKLSFKYVADKLYSALTGINASDIIFVAKENAIYVNGVKFGLPEDVASKVTDLDSAVAALKAVKHFGGIKVGSQIWTPATDGAALEIAGGGATTVSVSAGKLNITSTDYASSIADAKKAGTDATAALNAYKTTNDAAVQAAQSAADAAQDTADAKVASVAATTNKGIEIAGTSTAPTVGIKIDGTTPGNVTLSVGANGLKGSVTFPEDAVKGVSSTDKVLALGADKMVTSTLGLTYDATAKKIKLTGKGAAEIASIDATDFIKDGMINNAELIQTAESGVTEEVPYIKLTFNADGGNGVIRFSVKDLVDVYDGANLKLKAPTAASTYTAPAAGDSVDVAIGKLTKGVADAKAAGVQSFGGKTGAITLPTTSSTNGAINLAMTNNVLGASIVGLKSAAYTESSDYATAAQGTKANSAVQTVRAANTGTYISVAAAKSGTTINLTPSVTVQAVSTASTSAKGLAEALDVKTYVDSQLTWEEL